MRPGGALLATPGSRQAAPLQRNRERGRVRRTIEEDSKRKTQSSLPPRRETPLRDLALFFGEEFIPDLSVVRLVAVVLQLRHLPTHIE